MMKKGVPCVLFAFYFILGHVLQDKPHFFHPETLLNPDMRT